MYKLLLCLRYLRTRYIALASIISVMLGVATMIVVNSVMEGFSTEMRDRIHGILADCIVQSRSMNGISDPEEQMRIINEAAGEYIADMTPVVEVPGLMTFSLAGEPYTTPIDLIGIDPKGKSLVGPMVEYLESYKAVKRNGKMIPAQRSMDEPPTWELTQSAMDYRRRMKAYQRMLLGKEGFQTGATPHGPVTLASAEGPQQDVVTADQAEEIESQFDDEELPFDNEDVEPENTDEPLAARVYVGAGLISHPYLNPETGETEIRYLLNPGDDVHLGTVKVDRMEPTKFEATIVDTFKSGMSEYDGSLVFMNIEELQKMRGMITGIQYDDDGNEIGGVTSVTSIQIRLKDYADHEEVVRRLKAAFPPEKVSVLTWEDKQGPLLEAVAVESAILNVLLFLIIAVAGFGILAIFFMIVVEKTRDIGIMKALGASSKGIMSIFLSYGLALGVVGSTVGVVLGLLFVRYINEIEAGLSAITGKKVFDENIYYFTEIPTRVNAGMVVWVALGAMGIAVLASILPARRASRLRPVEALRYE